jgi:glycosyltransferase involved in cell wall biosynthesis
LARGDFLFFLNNDTEVMPSAIDALAGLLDRRADAGMVGARLVYPDGVLQEAGGIIWRDGSGSSYGNRDDPRKHQYNYVREVDYCSGAAIMLPRARWDEMGGFDEVFLPAYCEDSDLAFRLRAAGWKVLYQPRAIVVHHEGVSHGTDTGTGIMAYQVENTRKLALRWGETLAREALPNGKQIMRARDRATGRKITLVIDHYVPEPDRDAGSRTMIAFMEALVSSGRIVKFMPDNLYRTPEYSDALEDLGIEILHGPWTESLAVWISENGADVDEVLVSRPDIAAKYLPLLRQHCRAPLVFYGHDLHSARMRLEPGALQDSTRLKEISRMEDLERNVWRLVDVALYPSEDEAEAVRRMEPRAKVRAIQPYALSAPQTHAETAPASSTIIFVGGFRHTPNVDAAIWLATEILPLIQQERGNAKLLIVGSNPTQEVLVLAGPGIEVRGFVSDEELERLYAEARVALCPLRIGAGVKLKVVEAMHRGVPVVTTSIGAQGLPELPTLCDVADDKNSLATATLRLLSDDALWLARVEAQSDYVRLRFSIDAMRLALTTIFDDATRSR